MPHRRITISLGSAAIALVLATTACTSSGTATSPSSTDTSSSTSSPMTSSSSMDSMSSMSSMSSMPSSSTSNGTDPTATAAASLRSGLVTLFREHVNLTGFAVQTAVQDGLTSKNTTQALAALDANTVAIGKAVGSIYGAKAQTAFIKLWRAHIGFFVNYTKGLATPGAPGKALVTKAQKDLAGYATSFGKFLGTATGLPASAVTADLKGHISTLETAIKAIVSKSPSAASDLQMAAMHMDGTADVLAGGIAKQQKLTGDVDGKASALRAALTGLFIQHVAQTAAVVQTAVGSSLNSKQTAAAVKALDDNTVSIGDAIGSIYGKDAQTAFLKMWRAHIGFFVTYTTGLATGGAKGKAMVSKAQKQLAGYATEFGKFLGGATGLPASAVTADLQGHISTLETAIKAIVSNSPDAAAAVSAAETHMAGTGAVVASAIAKQQKLS